MTWKKVENSDNVKPAEIDETSSAVVVYVRRNFKLIEETEERPAYYEYEEQKISKDNWELYKQLIVQNSQLTDTQLALVEIYEMMEGLNNG